MKKIPLKYFIEASLVISILALTLSLSIWMNITPGTISSYFYQVDYINASQVRADSDIDLIFNSRYNSDLEEYLYCLYGDISDDAYIIEYIKETKYKNTENNVSYVPCFKNLKYLGTIHSHPQSTKMLFYSTCDLSDEDKKTFVSDKASITGVICGENKIAFYETKNLDESIEYVVI